MPSPYINVAASISVTETLHLLDAPFSSMAEGVSDGYYTFWLGSGISRGRVEDLKLLVRRVLIFLQEKIDPSDSSCRFKKALNDALGLINLTDAERTSVDFAVPVENWPAFDAIVTHLVSVYSKFLDVRVAGEKPDYLLWEAVDVCRTYADPGLKPDAEHLCVAILAMEGVLSNVASANWDGLVEAAVAELGDGTNEIIRTCVRGEDLQGPARRVSLLKFHGCAIRAKEDETNFRQLLVAREPQIVGWINDPAHGAICHHLIDLLMTHRTLVMGLSAQDSDIKFVFDKAKSVLRWPWPCEPPAYVFAEDTLGPDQLTVLRVVYGEDAYATHSADIDESALVRAYAKQLLAALLLNALFLKLCTLLSLATTSRLPTSDRNTLKTALRQMRDRVAERAHPDVCHFVWDLVEQSGKFLNIFRSGSTSVITRYYPLTTGPSNQIGLDPSLSTSGLPGLSVALSLLQLGHSLGFWVLLLAAHGGPETGALSVSTGSWTGKVFVVANSNVAVQISDAGHISESDPDVLVIVSSRLIPRNTRSPTAAPGRTGSKKARSVGIEDLLASTASTDDLLQRFREELVL